MEKRVYCQINGNRKVIGILRGYDVSLSPFSSSRPLIALAIARFMNARQNLSRVAHRACIQLAFHSS